MLELEIEFELELCLTLILRLRDNLDEPSQLGFGIDLQVQSFSHIFQPLSGVICTMV